MTGQTGHLPHTEEQIITTIDRLLPGLARILRQAIADPNDTDRITLPQLRALQAISRTEHPGALNAHLARQLHVAAPSMTAMIDGLVERGLVDRSTDPSNRRQVLILLTPEGSRRLSEMEAMVNATLREVVSHLSEDERARTFDGLKLLERAMTSFQQSHVEMPE